MRKKRISLFLCVLLCIGFSLSPVWALNETNPELEYIREAAVVHKELQRQFYDGSDMAKSPIMVHYNLTNFIGKYAVIENMQAPNGAINHREHTKRINDLLTTMANYKTTGISSQNKVSVDERTRIATYKEASDEIQILGAKDTRQARKKAVKIANAIASKTSDPKEQIRLVNCHLGNTVIYQNGTSSHSPAGALLDGKAVCEGYAYAFHLILNQLDIPVINVYGTSRGVDHMWNKVLVDGKWLYCDTTWNDSTAGMPTEEFLLLSERDFYSKSSHQTSSTSYEDIAVDILYRNQLELQAQTLKEKDLFQGDSSGFRLDDGLTRAEMAVILTCATGKLKAVEADKQHYASLCTFKDVPDWAKPYVGYCVSADLVSGTGNRIYGAQKKANKLDFCTVILRAAGIKGGYTYKTSDVKAAELGYISEARTAFADLTRGDVVHVLTRLTDQKRL